MNYQTAEQLTELKLNAMRLEYARQDELPASEELPFDDRLGMIVNAQYNARQKAKINRLIKAAELREPTATLSHLDFDPVRKLKKTEVARLSDCQWIKNGNNLIINIGIQCIRNKSGTDSLNLVCSCLTLGQNRRAGRLYCYNLNIRVL